LANPDEIPKAGEKLKALLSRKPKSTKSGKAKTAVAKTVDDAK